MFRWFNHLWSQILIVWFSFVGEKKLSETATVTTEVGYTNNFLSNIFFSF